MSLKALALVLIGSILHLGWNALAKKSHHKITFMWLGLTIPALYGGFLFIQKSPESLLLSQGFIYLFISIILHIFYLWILSKAYDVAALSFVYPFCRGIGALCATLGGLIIYEEKISIIGLIGISFSLIAILFEPIMLLKDTKKLNLKSYLYTGLTGLTIATYLLIDKKGVEVIPSEDYVPLMFFGMWLGLTPIILKSKTLSKELKSSLLRPFIASICMTGAYMLILFAMEFTEVGYVVSARSSGIIISGLVGLYFKEEITTHRWISILLISIGIVFIGMS